MLGQKNGNDRKYSNSCKFSKSMSSNWNCKCDKNLSPVVGILDDGNPTPHS